MADFNTHGGYFSPAGYMKINEGGSHEENPNGGVQVGVDPQGVPNMLEEGEPVYKDFVFSDNIRAQEQFLVEAGLPKHFAGKLYSEIVDELFAEAEERPNDPISRNGLDAMLSRVAQAQEAQKASEEEAQLMEEIRNMSPEEYAALEQAMMAQEQPVEQPMPSKEMAMVPEDQMQPDMMPVGYAQGGLLHQYKPGGPISTRELQQQIADNQALIDRVQRSYRYNESPYLYNDNGDPRGVIGGDGLLGFLSGAGLLRAGKALRVAGAPVRGAKAIGEWGSSVKKAAAETAEVVGKTASEARAAKKAARQAMSESGKKIIDAAKKGEEVSAETIEQYNAQRQAFQEARAASWGAGAKKAGADIAEASSKLLPGKGAGKMTVDAATDIAEQASVAVSSTQPAVEAVKKANGLWPKFLKTSVGLGLLGGGYAAYNKFFAPSEKVKEYDSKGSTEEEFVSFDDFLNGFERGGAINKFENGTRYGRTPNGQLVQIVDRTDGNGTTWQEYIPVQESGNIDSANIVSLPQVNVTYNRPVASAPHAFMIPYGGGFGGGVRGGLSGNVYAVNSGTANGTAIGGGARGNMYDLGELPEVTVYPPATGTVSVGGMMPQAEVVGYRGAYNLPEAQVVGYRNPGQRGSSSGNIPAGLILPTAGHLSDNEFDIIINGRGNVPLLPGIGLPVGSASTASGSLAGYNNWLGNRLKGTPTTDVDSEVVVNDGRNGRPSVLSTLPRYAGAIGSGLLALNTLLQQPDHYEDTPIRPALPTGRILLQDQRYMPLDMNAVTNQMQAQNTANARAIMNSGAGPSTGALIAAADYTGGLNLGNALGNVWQANNQERNRVISANNQNAATRAQFYRDLNSQRAQILNNMAMYNRQNALRTAMLNNQAEQAKYNAFSQNLGNALQALSGIGQENFAMNQLNTNTALGWYVGPDGRAYYRGSNWSNCGGLLKKIKK